MKPTNPNKHKPNKHTKSTKISSLFPKRGNRNTKRTEKHKNKLTHGKSMPIASLVKIPCYLLNLSSGNENMGVSRTDNSVKLTKMPISNLKPDLHNINAHSKFGENLLMFTQVIIRKRKTDGRRTEGHTDVQRETIIPRHYCLARYKKRKQKRKQK